VLAASLTAARIGIVLGIIAAALFVVVLAGLGYFTFGDDDKL
jgi:hypothetical protein